MMSKSKVPQIRFKGFSEEWDSKELTNYSTKIGDGLHGTPKYVSNTGIYFINGNNLESGSILISNETKEVTKEDSLKNDKQLTSNTILMSINGTIGNLAWYQNETVMLGKSVAYITLKNCDKSYMYCYLQSVKISNYFFNNLTGSTIKNLGLKTIRETEISIPTEITEQIKIGDYFQQIDKVIEQKEKKYQKLKQFKKAMLDKMFPKNGVDTPEIRFKGFNGKWEEKKLGDIGKTYTGLSAKTKEDFGHGEGKFVTYMNVFSNPISKQNLTEPIEIDEKQNEVQFGDVFFTTSSETPDISNSTLPGFTTATQYSGDPLPLPIRVSAGFFVTGLSGYILIHILPVLFRCLEITILEDSICLAVILELFRDFSPNSPKFNSFPFVAILLLFLPFCCFLNFVLLGCNIVYL